VSQPSNTPNQKWRIVPAQGQGAGKGYAIISALNGSVLDIKEGKIKNEAEVITWKNLNQSNQAWAISPV
jgi:hypothetical protein